MDDPAGTAAYLAGMYRTLYEEEKAHHLISVCSIGLTGIVVVGVLTWVLWHTEAQLQACTRSIHPAAWVHAVTKE